VDVNPLAGRCIHSNVSVSILDELRRRHSGGGSAATAVLFQQKTTRCFVAVPAGLFALTSLTQLLGL
jgi:hypothetical protein